VPRHNLESLYKHYPAIIGQVSRTFTSHKFILCLAQQHQA